VLKALPLWQAIEMVRDFTLGIVSTGILWHVLYFVVMAIIGVTATTKRLTKLFLR